MEFRSLITDQTSNLDIAWFDNFDLPNFRTAEVVGFEIRSCDSIIYTNSNDQVVNVARSTGTDYANRDRIMNTIESRGMQIDVLPPVILQNGEAVDGFTRGSALARLNVQEWIYLVVKLRDGFHSEDLKDEMGLGCNDHSPCKPAQPEDFEVRLRKWIQRYHDHHQAYPSKKECIAWWNNIPNSFSDKIRDNRIEKVLNDISSDSSVVSYDGKEATAQAKIILQDKLDRSKLDAIIPINFKALKGKNNASNGTYLDRAFCRSMFHARDGKQSTIVGFISHVSAEQIAQERKNLVEEVARYNKAFRAAVQQYNTDPTFELFTVEGFLPQVLDHEDGNELITDV